MKNDQYHDLLKKYELTDSDLSRMFGYKTVQAFRSSSARKRHQESAIALITHIAKKIREKV